MKIKAFVLLLCLSLLLCSCGGNGRIDKEAVASLSDAIEATNSETRVSGKYMLEISFGDSVTLYYASGDAAWDLAEETAHAIFTQTYLGSTGEAENYYSDGVVLSVAESGSVEVEREPDELFSMFPYAKAFSLPDDISELSVSQSTLGKTYTVKRSDTADICSKVIGGDIFTIVDVLKKPQADKTQYSDATCVYTVNDGRLTAYRYEFDVKLFDTPAYIPGYSVPEDEYTLELHVVARMSYNGFGSDVTVKEYEAESDESSQISS